MDNIQYLKKTYKNKIEPMEHSVEQVIIAIKNRIDIKEINTDLISPIYFKMMKKNAYHCALNQIEKLNEDEMDFIAFKVIKNEKSKHYYKEDIDNILKDNNAENCIIILIEKNIKYSTVNCERLQLEILIS